MAIEATDLQPTKFEVTVNGKQYWCNPPRMAHRIILMKVRPLFVAIADLAEGKDVDVSSEKMLEYQGDLDTLFNDLIPQLKKDEVHLNEQGLVDVINELVKNSMPEEAKELDKAKVKVGEPEDPKAGTTG